MSGTEAVEPWWQRAVGYQIYPRSFMDGNGDGIGDIAGIRARLGHLAELGIGFVWLSPVFRSPMADNGYDIADYRDVDPVFGTLAEMDALIAEARALGIGIVMDLVVNHTSDRHPWFEAARADRGAPTRGWYVWRDPAPGGGPPDDRQSYFGGPAWSLSEATGQYYLHLFSPGQPDLDWSSAAMRAEIHATMRWWLDRGVAGFRMDVIDHIGKDVDAGEIVEGPHLWRHLAEMEREVLRGRDAVSIAEAWGATPATGPLYCGRDGALSMVFQFNHIVAGWDPVHGKWRPRARDLGRLKRSLFAWQAAMEEDGWAALFLGNHDLPRMVSSFGCDGQGRPGQGCAAGHRVASARALALALHLLKGTPFVYQGDEIGMANARFAAMGQFRDLETLNHHRIETARGVEEAAFVAGANANGRDNARTPMQWDGGPHAGFSEVEPWISVPPGAGAVNVAADRADPRGVMAMHRALIALRRDVALVRQGRTVPFAEDDPAVMAYARQGAGGRIAVVANLSCEARAFDVPAGLALRGRSLVATHGARDALEGRVSLAPWEAAAVIG